MNRVLLLAVWLGASCGEADPEIAPPTTGREMHEFVQQRLYEPWHAESAVLPGLNETARRVFVNEHVVPAGSPTGAAAVREIWNADASEPLGWSALVKTDRGWWFFETFDTEPGGDVAVAQFDAPGCMGCHAAAPDMIQSTLPLR